MSVPYAIQNMCIKFGKKPSLILLICKGIADITNQLSEIKNKKIMFVNDEEKLE